VLYHGGLGQCLLERFDNPEGVFRQSEDALRSIPGIRQSVLERLASATLRRVASEEVRRAREEGVHLLFWRQAGYPRRLWDLETMPLVLYVQGLEEAIHGEAQGAPSVGIVGSRRPTPYGLKQTDRLATGLAHRGLTIVSGLASGVDGQAHRSCLEAGGRTVAVLGSGLDRPYPRQHCRLLEDILRGAGGAVVSEFPFGTSPRSFHFPMRNRILSGLSDALVVVEAGERSGSLITARHALDQGRTVYVVPGRIAEESIGGLRLLVDGATPVLDAGDILPGIPGPQPGPPAPVRRLDGPLGPRLEECFGEDDAWYPDRLAERLGTSAPAILAELGRLETEGQLERLPCGAYMKRLGR
jgi:DNA processing protein